MQIHKDTANTHHITKYTNQTCCKLIQKAIVEVCPEESYRGDLCIIRLCLGYKLTLCYSAHVQKMTAACTAIFFFSYDGKGMACPTLPLIGLLGYSYPNQSSLLMLKPNQPNQRGQQVQTNQMQRRAKHFCCRFL